MNHSTASVVLCVLSLYASLTFSTPAKSETDIGQPTFFEKELRRYEDERAKKSATSVVPFDPLGGYALQAEDIYYVLSMGRGGKTGFQEYSYRSANGKFGKFKMTIPDDIGDENPYGFLLYLHGDIAADYDWFYDSLVSVAKKHHLIPIAVHSPSGNENGPSWWVDADRNAEFLDELLKKQVLARYNIDKRRAIFTGASGGPTFMNGPWLRHYASQYRGGAILFCGGLVTTEMPLRSNKEFTDQFTIFYYNGTSDFLYAGAQAAIDYYKDKGFKIYGDFPAGQGHCTYPIVDLMDSRVATILDSIPSNLMN